MSTPQTCDKCPPNLSKSSPPYSYIHQSIYSHLVHLNLLDTMEPAHNKKKVKRVATILAPIKGFLFLKKESSRPKVGHAHLLKERKKEGIKQFVVEINYSLYLFDLEAFELIGKQRREF